MSARPHPAAPPPRLAPRLARLMAPLALLALAAIGVALPALYSRALLSERAAEARADAQRLALRYGLLAARDEGLWAYAYGALALEARPLTASGALVRLDTPRRPAAFVALPEGAAAPPPPGAPLAYGGAPVLARGEEVGRVGVWRPAEDLGALQRRLWLLAAVVALATAGGTLVLPTRAARRADAEIRALWDELSALNATLEARVEERTRQLARLSNRLMRAQEEERARVSRDLHDDLGQALTGLRLQLTALLRAPGAPPPLAPLIAGVDDSIARVRALAHDLRPPELDALGLSHALRRHLEGRAAAAGLALSLLDELEGAGESPLTAAESDAVFRVAQEALTNVLRHAHAARVDVRLWRDAAGWLCLRVVDDGDGRGGGAAGDGRGGGAAGDGRGLGLLGAAERARELGGHLSALPRAPSHPLGGFSLLLRLPPPS